MSAVKIVVVALVLAAPASALASVQHVSVADGGEVNCTLSLRGITRISAVGDAFVTDIKRSASDPAVEFSVANEPNRGDIYVSLPDASPVRTVSFFTITRKNFVYQFRCSVSDVDSQQIFIENPAAVAGQEAGPNDRSDIWERSVALLKAVGEDRPLPGYVVSAGRTKPAFVGPIKVSVEVVYTGVSMVGKRVRIENTGNAPISLSDQELSPPGTIVMSVSKHALKPHETALEYVVLNK